MYRMILVMLCLGVVMSVSAQSFQICDEMKEDKDNVWHQGSEDWVFANHELREQYNPDLQFIEGMKDVTTVLRSQGIELVLVPVPTRSLLSSNYLDPADTKQKSYDVNVARVSFNNMVNQLSQQTGAVVVNSLTAMLTSPEYQAGEALYFKRNHHWNNLGATIAARGVATAIRSRLPEQFKSFQSQTYTLEKSGIDEVSTVFAATLKRKCNQEVATEPQDIYEALPNVPTADGLLIGDPTYDLVLVGTSFSTSQFNFDSLLTQELGTDVLNFAVGAGRTFTSIQDYLLSQSYLSHKPKVIVWEFVDSDIDVETKSNFLGDFRQLIASTYGDCQDAEVALGTNVIDLSSIVSGLPNLVERPIGEWEKGEGASFELVNISDDGSLPVTKIVMQEQPRYVRYRQDLTESLLGKVFLYSVWLWSDAPNAKKFNVEINDSPKAVEKFKFRTELQSEPTQYFFVASFSEANKQQLSLQMGSGDNFSYYARDPRLVEVDAPTQLKLLDLASLGLNPSDYYAVFDIADKSLVKFDVLTHYSDGSQNSVTVERSTRIANNGKFFLDIAPSTSPLTSIELLPSFRNPATPIEVSAKLCKKTLNAHAFDVEIVDYH